MMVLPEDAASKGSSGDGEEKVHDWVNEGI